VEQELPNLPEHLRTSPVFSAVRSVDFSFLCLPFKFVPFLLIMVLSVLHRCTTSGYLLCSFSVDHGVVCPSSMYNFWLSRLLFSSFSYVVY
jgi:hypothetical protein